MGGTARRALPCPHIVIISIRPRTLWCRFPACLLGIKVDSLTWPAAYGPLRQDDTRVLIPHSGLAISTESTCICQHKELCITISTSDPELGDAWDLCWRCKSCRTMHSMLCLATRVLRLHANCVPLYTYAWLCTALRCLTLPIARWIRNSS